MTDEANPSAPPGDDPRTAWDDRVPAGPAAPVAGPVDAVPLRLVAVGLLVAALDLRVVAVDLLPDVVGWALVAVGVRRLPGLLAGGRAPAAAAAAAAVAAVLGLADQVVALAAPGARGDVVGAVLGSGGTITLGGQVFSLAAVASAAAVLAVSGVVAELAAQAGDEVSAARWTRLRFVYVCSAVPGLAICLMLLVGGGGAPGMVLATVLLAVGSVTYLLLVWRAFRDARRPWALPGRVAAAPVTSPPITA